jgi:hypothetical protein
MQWLQDTNQSNVDNLNNVKHEASRHFNNKMKEYLKAKIDELETNSKIKNIRDYHSISLTSRTDMVKDEKGDLVRDSLSILARCRNNFT